jgi:HEAT repeat protein/beta-lactamase regulating signal transducer with metallopeptidase domain
MTPADLDAGAAVVLSWLLTYAIHSTILLALAAVAAWRFADQHAWLDLIWKVALVAPLVTASLHLDPIALPLGGRLAMPSVTTVSETPAAVPAAADEAPMAPARAVEPATSLRAVDRVSKSDHAVAPGAGAFPVWKAMVRRWPSIAALAWLIIASFSVAWYCARLRGTYRALGSGAAVTSTDLLDAINRLRSGANHRRSIRLTTSAMCPVPLALAGRHIVLPGRFMRELEPEQQQAALAHELAHVTRRDPEWRIAVEILERALFFQPLNRLARARLCDSAEFLCDEWAVQQTQSPLALARCLSVVASWWSPAEALPAGVSAMARSDSAMVQRVTRILSEPARIARPRLHWLAIPVTLVAIAAPRVTATQLPAAAAVLPPAAAAAVIGAASPEKTDEQSGTPRQSTAAEIAAARAQLRVYRSPRPAGSLEERWRDALADAGKQGLNDFWIVYTFNTPTHADDMVISDSRGDSIVSSNGDFSTQGPPLIALLNPSAAVPLEGGDLAVLMHYRGTRADAIDRAGYRSAQLGFDFGRTPVFWLGDAPEAQSFSRVESLFGQARTEKIQVLLIELASMHSNTDVVAPFLTRLVDPSRPPAIRREAAEGFDHHHDPRSVEILLRVARTDPDSSVRAEAAETIGEVQTPQSIPALTDLARDSADPEVRREAAEGFGDQPADRALPALESLIATSDDDDVLSEAIEALGDLGLAAMPVLLRTADTHPNRAAQLEAVETLGDIDDASVVDALTRIVSEHRDVAVQREAVETLGDRHDDPAAVTALERIARQHDREEVQVEAIETLADRPEQPLHPLILELAVSGSSARIRREALDSIGDAIEKVSDVQLLDRAQQAIERAIFDDPDHSVRVDGIDALDKLPNDRAVRVLRDVIARHPDARVRREAEEHVRERQ